MSKNKHKINKKSEITNLDVNEVSLVTAGANKKKAFLIKSENGEEIMPGDNLIEKLENFEFADKEKTEESLAAVAKEAGLDETQQEGLMTALAIMESLSKSQPYGYSFDTSQGHACISIYKADEEQEGGEEGETPEGAEEEASTDTEGSEELKKAEDKIEKLSALIEDKDSVEAILKGEEQVEFQVPASIQKQLDDQQAELSAIRKEKEEAQAETERIQKEADRKEFVGSLEEDVSYIAKAEDIADPLTKCKDALSEEEYETVITVLKSANAKIKESSLFKEVGETVLPEEEKDEEAVIQKLAEEKVAKAREDGDEVSIEKARTLVRKERRTINNNKNK